MTYAGPLNTIVLTNITGRDQPDVICFHSVVSWDAFKAFVESREITYKRITVKEAATILNKTNGVGYGCYSMDGVKPEHQSAIQSYRKALARSNKSDIGNITGLCSIFEPLQVSESGQATVTPLVLETALSEAPRAS